MANLPAATANCRLFPALAHIREQGKKQHAQQCAYGVGQYVHYIFAAPEEGQ